MISQAYFDEVCLENAELFDLGEAEAVKETIVQLSAEGLHHLSLTFPSSDNGIKDRQIQQNIKVLVDSLEGDTENAVKDTLRLWKDEARHWDQQIFLAENGLEKLINSIPIAMELSTTVLIDSLCTILVLLEQKPAKSLINSFQAIIASQLLTLASAYSENREDPVLLSPLLKILLWSVKRCEANKKIWMKLSVESTDTADLLVATLEKCSHEASFTHTRIANPLCQFLTSLCTFDDFTSKSSSALPTVSSSHSTVQKLANLHIVARLDALLRITDDATPVILCLRSVAIQDATVQTIMAKGTFETARSYLAEESPSSSAVELVTAVIGLLRNLCGNDDIKTTFCLGSSKSESFVPSLFHFMEKYPGHAILQEHACATIGAMALRKVANAEFLVKHLAHTWIVRAMRRHPDRATLQRQACLAIRNLVARSPNLSETLLEEPIEETLQAVAQKHASCQDEVYAALRDLGLKATRCEVVETSNGETVLRPTEQFGQAHNSKFRPVFD